MQPTRRDFLRLGLGTSTLLACEAAVPLFLARSAAALAADSAKNPKGRILIVLQLDGGNDGLNTVVPYRDDEYRKHRPKLQLPADRVHKINDRIGFHPGLAKMSKLLEDRRLAIVQSVGYPNPNRSHFESMAIWHTARPEPAADTPGWLARWLDVQPPAPGGDTAALHIGGGLPQALAGSQQQVPALASLDQFRRRVGVPESAGANEQRAALDQLAAQKHATAGSLLEFVERSTLVTYTSSARLEGLIGQKTTAVGYPEFSALAQRFKLIAQLIKAGLTTSLYYTELGGFDTHANQLDTHFFLLRQVGDTLQAFLDDLRQAGEDQRVLVLVFSEFGRRLAENASGGTDHGTAAPVFLLGPGVRAGVHGPYPNLQDLADGDPKHGIDFRQVYAAVLERWLNCKSEGILGGTFTPLPIL